MTPAAREASVGLPSQNTESIGGKNPFAGYFHKHRLTHFTGDAFTALPALQQVGELENDWGTPAPHWEGAQVEENR